MLPCLISSLSSYDTYGIIRGGDSVFNLPPKFIFTNIINAKVPMSVRRDLNDISSTVSLEPEKGHRLLFNAKNGL